MSLDSPPANHECPEAPNADEVRDELQKILKSSTFLHSPVQSAFLMYVVEMTLMGEGKRLKAYTVAVDGLGRSPDFDADADATVRVYAVRVRDSLRRYYQREGAEDAIILRLPCHSYAAVFSRAV